MIKFYSKEKKLIVTTTQMKSKISNEQPVDYVNKNASIISIKMGVDVKKKEVFIRCQIVERNSFCLFYFVSNFYFIKVSCIRS